METDRYQKLPLQVRNVLTGEVCRLARVAVGDRWCSEGHILMEHVNGNEITWSLYSTERYPVFNAKEWKLESIFDQEAVEANNR